MTTTIAPAGGSRGPEAEAGPANRRARTPNRAPALAALVALNAVTAVSFCRVFAGWGFLPAMLAATAFSHAAAWACRRFRVPLLGALPLSAAGAVWFVALGWYRSTTRFAVPTGRTITAMRADLSAAMSTFATAVPPVPSRGGFLVAAALGVWLIVLLADSLAFRAMAGVEAVLPAALGFTLTSAVGASRLRLPITVVWLVVAMVTVAMLRALRSAAAGAWLAGRARSADAALRWGALAAVGATVAGLVLGTHLPGYGKQPLVKTRNSVSTDRIAVSPSVDIKPRLSKRTPATAFTVTTDGGRSYWRLTTLDEFDGRRWQSPSHDYQRVSGALGITDPPADGKQTTATITIAGLTNEFVPAAPAPVDVASTRKLSWEPDLQSLIVANGKLKKGERYTITSVRPTNVTPDELRAASVQMPANIAGHYLDLPDESRQAIEAIAHEQTDDAQSTYDKMRALQDYFRSQYRYSLNVPAGNGQSAIDAFLEQRVGYCEQFSATFAAMARVLGIPSRVAVGFTYGIARGNGVYEVQDKHAHAWPEIYFAGYGWIPFEPTPSRGNPDAEQITGVATQQADESPAGGRVNNGLPELPNLPSVPRTNDVENRPRPTTSTTVAKQSGAAVPAPVWWALGIAGTLGTLVGGWMLLVHRVTARRWRRRREAAATASKRTVLAWHHAVDGLERTGITVPSSETPTQVARRVARNPAVAATDLARLADLATVAGFSGVEVDDTVLGEAETLAAAIRAKATGALDRRARLGRRFDPRPMWRPLPGDRHDEPAADRPGERLASR